MYHLLKCCAYAVTLTTKSLKRAVGESRNVVELLADRCPVVVATGGITPSLSDTSVVHNQSRSALCSTPSNKLTITIQSERLKNWAW
uniref:TPP_enzyme_M domain-containing protein n=1 Tax=Heterorhabditis bacteriophora TaxID=37862 RepID=A0A1I7X4A5_HETBA